MKTRHGVLAGWVLLVYALHQDNWNWQKGAPLWFDLLPPGLVYHLGYSVLAALTMAMLVRWAWPKELEENDRDHDPRP